MVESPSDEEMRRAREMFRRILGRDLSPEEQKYLALSSIAVSLGDLEFIDRDATSENQLLQ